MGGVYSTLYTLKVPMLDYDLQLRPLLGEKSVVTGQVVHVEMNVFSVYWRMVHNNEFGEK